MCDAYMPGICHYHTKSPQVSVFNPHEKTTARLDQANRTQTALLGPVGHLIQNTSRSAIYEYDPSWGSYSREVVFYTEFN